MAKAKLDSAFLTTAGLGKLFDVSPRTVRRWTEQGYIPKPVRVGGPRGAYRWHRSMWTAARMRQLYRAEPGR